MTILTISQDTLIMLPDGSTGGTVQISYNGTTTGPVIASGDDQGRAVLVQGRLAKLTALDGESPLQIVGREARGRLPARVTLRIYPEGSATVAPIILSGLPVGSPDAPGIWDLSNIGDASGGMDVVLPSERQALAVLRERGVQAAERAEGAAATAQAAEGAAAQAIVNLGSRVDSAAQQAAAGTVARVDRALADTAQKGDAALIVAQAGAEQAVLLGTQALEQGNRLTVAAAAELPVPNNSGFNWAYAADTRMLYRWEADHWEQRGEGAAPAAQYRVTQAQAAALNLSDIGEAVAADMSSRRYQIGGPRGGTFDLVDNADPLYNDPDAAGGMLFKRADGRALRRWEYDTFVVATHWDLSGNDCAPELQKAVNYARKRRKALIIPASPYAQPYILRSRVNVPNGVRIIGDQITSDTTSKGNDDAPLQGTVILIRDNGGFNMNGASVALHMTLYYDEQLYNVQVDTNQPDGLSAFKQYPPTFSLIGSYNGCEIGHILVLGAYDFVVATWEAVADKMNIHDIRGCVLNRGIAIGRAIDLTYASNIHLSPNSLAPLTMKRFAAQNFDWKRLCTKIARNFVMFDFGRVDDFLGTNIFVYAAAAFVRFHKVHAADDAKGGGAHFVNASCDGVGTFVLMERSEMQIFGVKFTSGFATPMVYGSVIDGVRVPDETGPTLVRFASDCFYSDVIFLNFKAFGAQDEAVLVGTGQRHYTVFAEANSGRGGNVMFGGNTVMTQQGAWWNDRCESASHDDLGRVRVHTQGNLLVNNVRKTSVTQEWRFSVANPAETFEKRICGQPQVIVSGRAKIDRLPTAGAKIALLKNGQEIGRWFFGPNDPLTAQMIVGANHTDRWLAPGDTVSLIAYGLSACGDVLGSYLTEGDIHAR